MRDTPNHRENVKIWTKIQSGAYLLSFMTGDLRGVWVVFELSRAYFFEKSYAHTKGLIIRLGKYAAKVIPPSEAVCSCGTLRTIDKISKYGPKSSLEPTFLAS